MLWYFNITSDLKIWIANSTELIEPMKFSSWKGLFVLFDNFKSEQFASGCVERLLIWSEAQFYT